MTLAVGILQMLFIRLGKFSSVSTQRSVFNYKEVLDFFFNAFCGPTDKQLVQKLLYVHIISLPWFSVPFSQAHGSRESRLDTAS